MDSKVNNNLLIWMNNKYGKHGAVTETRGKRHDYLGMIFIYKNRKLKIDMKDYIKKMLKEFSIKFKSEKKIRTPAETDMFEEDRSKRLTAKHCEEFHKMTMKALFLCK